MPDDYHDEMDGVSWSERYTHLSADVDDEPISKLLQLENELDAEGYTKDWKLIAAAKRRERNFTCEECGVRLLEFPWLLHVHHLDRNKENNDANNLRVLCALCHSLPDDHAHLRTRINSGTRILIESLRSEVARQAPTPSEKELRCVTDVGQYKIFAAYFRGEFRGKARSSMKGKLPEITVTSESFNGAQMKVRQLAFIELMRATVIKKLSRGQAVALKSGVNKGPIRATHCYKCKTPLASICDVTCTTCGWLMCSNCGSCGCGYTGW